MKNVAAVILGVLMLVGFTPASYAEWSYGIGTGLFRMNAQGDQGFNTQIAGPVKFEIDLDPEDFDDLRKSVFGFGGYATNRKWLIQYSFSNLELEDKSSQLVGATTVNTKIGFTITGAEVTVGYPVKRSPSVVLRVLGGVRYTKHELKADIQAGAQVTKRKIDNGWTDALIGFTVDVPLSKKWVWGSRIDAGFGDSEGTYSANTGFTWRFHKHWSSTFFAKYTAVEFENGKRGDPDWYLYDVNEFGIGVNILYHF
jgi:Outer membrane protein beta-barrel domain